MQLVRKKLVFQAQNTGIIKYNYYYDLMKEIYATITLVDDIESLKLHEEGYQVDNKKYKLFNYNLIFMQVLRPLPPKLHKEIPLILKLPVITIH
jgi:CRISPR-associated endoribonuclease Cas6